MSKFLVEILPRVCDVPYYVRIPNFLFSSAKNVNEYFHDPLPHLVCWMLLFFSQDLSEGHLFSFPSLVLVVT